MTKIKTHVIFIGRKFPSFHPRKGEETYFLSMIIRDEKTLTIRDDYNKWSKRINEVNEGKAVISLRYWLDRPFHSTPQEVMRITDKNGAGCHKFQLVGSQIWVDDLPMLDHVAINQLLQKDGLNYKDFMAYHTAGKAPETPKALIYFNNFRF
jgi:hypothetical protein